MGKNCAGWVDRSGQQQECQFADTPDDHIFRERNYCEFHLPLGEAGENGKRDWSEEQKERLSDKIVQQIEIEAKKTRSSTAILNFSGVVFAGRLAVSNTTLPETNFECAHFERSVSFIDIKFHEKVLFSGAYFLSDVSFENSVFSKDVFFDSSGFGEAAPEFSGDINFQNVKFFGYAVFNSARIFGSARFVDAEFYDRAYFNNTKFPANTYFRNASFINEADFDASYFTGLTDFVGAKFQKGVGFVASYFGGEADFRDTEFESISTFDSSKFVSGVLFEGARFKGFFSIEEVKFENTANFKLAKFSKEVSFARSNFAEASDFRNAIFLEHANFFATDFMSRTKFDGAQFHGDADFLGVALLDQTGSSTFQEVSFNRAVFLGEADFSNRIFLDQSDFQVLEFKCAPIFYGSTMHQRTLFCRVESFLDRSNDDAANRYRVIRLGMENQRDRLQEGMFYALEQESRRRSGEINGVAWWINRGYQMLSAYGLKIERPLIWFAAIIFFNALFIFFVTTLTGVRGADVDRATRLEIAGDALIYSARQSVIPFDALRQRPETLDSWELFPRPHGLFLVIAAFQSIFSALTILLMLLAVRWRYRR